MRFVLIFLLSIPLSCIAAPAAAAETAPASLLDSVPIQFEPARGQQKDPDSPVRWSAHGFGYSYAFTDNATILRAAGSAVTLTFPGAKPARLEGADQTHAATNYFVGQRYVSVPAFRRLRRVGVYPGVDVVYYGHGRELEYDFEIAPGADPSRIRMRFEGAGPAHANTVQLNNHGEIVLAFGSGEVTQRVPVVYQRTREGGTVKIDASYRRDRNGDVRLVLGRYNITQPLVVDPVLSYTEFFSSTTGANVAITVKHDSQATLTRRIFRASAPPSRRRTPGIVTFLSCNST